MFHVLIDTCVWLDLAQDPKQTPLLLVVEKMVHAGGLKLLVPRVVVDEFQRNRARVAKASSRSLASHFQQVKDAVKKLGGDSRKQKTLLAQLDDVNHRMPIVGDVAEDALNRIEKLLSVSVIVETLSTIKLNAADRALHRRGPCHQENKNSIADAIVIETYFDAIDSSAEAGQRFAFVTHNTKDFGVASGNLNLPHPDLADRFSRIKSMYFICLAECLRRIDPTMVSRLMREQSWSQETRGLTELLRMEDFLFNQLWYNRHQNLRVGIAEGRVELVDEEIYPRKPGMPETCQRDVWIAALAAAKAVERKYGKKNLGPWDDFEWGMINGKLSAIRWMLGDEWDMLDT
ncbi:MAG: hypothetical protein CFE39_17165 [Comamonadaceae bacterium PBBC2]|nr:MAG: hypothetical protein CFE39_17165 [Comamonadaceae bacterium PBBC2]